MNTDRKQASSFVGTVGVYESPTDFRWAACLFYSFVCPVSILPVRHACLTHFSFQLTPKCLPVVCVVTAFLFMLYSIHCLPCLELEIMERRGPTIFSNLDRTVLPLSLVAYARSKAPRSWISFSNPSRIRRKNFSFLFPKPMSEKKVC